MQTRPTLAITVIAKNEINNIERLTKSIEGCFDKYILVDTGSTDGTIEKAKELGWQVEHFEWIQDFAAARNYALQFVKTDYWFWGDLDDSLPDKEAFLSWRDNIMLLADMWLVPYYYTTTPEGLPLCTFLRERCFKTALGCTWKYPIHEGIVPPQGTSVQVTTRFHVRHHRTAEDMVKDKGRNLRVFEKQIKDGHVFEPRESYYYGKELLENNRPVEAAHFLGIAAGDATTELHDKLLSIQFCAVALQQCNQWERAMLMASEGLKLAPTRAEYHCIISDSYLKMGNQSAALPFLHAAQGCPKPSGTGVIFNDMASYYIAPRNNIASIYANAQDFEKAEKILAETAMNEPNSWTNSLMAQVSDLKSQLYSYKNAKACDDIVITCPPNGAYKWDSKIYQERSMGGSETAAIEMSRWLTKLSGRKVIIFNPRDDEYVDDVGVEYKDVSQIHGYMAENKPYLHVAWRHALRCTDAFTLVWSHDLFTQGAEDHRFYDLQACLTPFHKNWIQNMQGIPDEKLWITRNGIVPERFIDGPWEKKKNQFVFSSSPDRGLDRAILVLSELKKEFPDITLNIAYGWAHLDNYGQKDLRLKLEQMVSERKDWITYHGGLQQDKLMKLMKESQYCIQPSDFIESSKISALEMLFCKVYQITRGVGGCVDTMKEYENRGMCTMVYSDCKTAAEYQLYIDATRKAIEEEAYKRIIDVNPYTRSWEEVAKDWIKHLFPLCDKKR